MIYILLKGLLIGFLSSAPMGPVGMLCVQRTLNDGRQHGLVTGIGAMTGDIIFAFIAVIAALGLGFSTEYIEGHKAPLQIAGSLILIIFGFIVFNKNPSKNLAKLAHTQLPFGKVFVSSLALTLSNIATLFLYIALFARLNVIDASKHFGYDLLTILFIGLGALMWWVFITYIVNKLRNKFNPRGLKVFNRIIGSVFMGIGIVGIITGAYMQFTGIAL